MSNPTKRGRQWLRSSAHAPGGVLFHLTEPCLFFCCGITSQKGSSNLRLNVKRGFDCLYVHL